MSRATRNIAMIRVGNAEDLADSLTNVAGGRQRAIALLRAALAILEQRVGR